MNERDDDNVENVPISTSQWNNCVDDRLQIALLEAPLLCGV